MPAFLSQGFRPLFLAAALWSATALALWIVMFATGAVLPSRFDPLTWHIHEMLFGFVMAGVAGFLLTVLSLGLTGSVGMRMAMTLVGLAMSLFGIIGVLNNGLFLLNVSPFWQQVIKGGVILVAVAIDKMNARNRDE